MSEDGKQSLPPDTESGPENTRSVADSDDGGESKGPAPADSWDADNREANRPAIPPPPILPNEDACGEVPDLVIDTGDSALRPTAEARSDSSVGDPAAPEKLPMKKWPWQLPWRRIGLFSSAGAVILGIGLTIGYAAGTSRAYRFQYDPFTNYCGPSHGSMTEAAMHRRNQIWRVWNDGAIDDDDSLMLAAVIAAKIHPGFDKSLAGVVGDLTLKSKWITRTSDPRAVNEALTSDNGRHRAQAFLNLMKADAEAGEIIREVMCDDRRVGLFLQGETIPLEAMPNGVVP